MFLKVSIDMPLQWQYNHLVIPLSISIAFVLVLLGLSVRWREHPMTRPYVILMGCALIWLITSLIEIVTLNLQLSLLAADLSFLGTTFVPLAWVSIIMTYNNQGPLLRRWLPWLSIVPLLTNIIIWTNSWHHLWRGDSYRDLTTTWFPISVYNYGPWFYVVHSPYSLLLILGAMFLMWRLYTRRKNYRVPVVIMLTAFNLILVVELLHQAGIDPLPHYTATPLVFPISGSLIAIALFRHHILDLRPIARDLVLENMLELMIVLDNLDRITDFNTTAQRNLFQGHTVVIGMYIGTMLSEWNTETGFTNDTLRINEMTIRQNGEDRIYQIRISPIIESNGEKYGTLLLMRDITSRKQAEKTIYEQVHQMAIMDERQRLARELHDSVSQSLFAARTLADLLPRAIEIKPEKVPDYAFSIQQLIHGATAEMRLILLELYPDALIKTDIGTILKYLCDAHTGSTKTPIDFFAAPQIHLDQESHIMFFRIAQEALHNINKHADANSVRVELTERSGVVQLVIQDNGCGFDPSTITSDHFGLANMAQRANHGHAILKVVSKIDQGTTITLTREPS